MSHNEKESTEGPVSTSTHSLSTPSSDSISIDPVEPFEPAAPEYVGDAPELQLTPHISRTTDPAGKSNIDITLARTRTAGTTATNNDPSFEIDFDDGENPHDWSLFYRGVIIGIMSFGTTTVVLYSTSYTSAIPGLVKTFGITDQIGILGVTTYLLGLAAGSLVLAPLSEMYGRRPVYILSMASFALLVLPCALATHISSILVARFFGAFAAAAMISNAPGSVNDIVDEKYRALAFSVWSIGPMNGPVIGPVVGGFVYQYMGWRWTNWVVMILSGAAWAIISAVPETYAPAILRAKAAKKRKQTGDSRWWCRYDDKKAFWPLLKINLSRPFVMTVTEPILIFWDISISLVYGCLYLCFVAYPIIFTQQRGWSPGISGLAFCGIGLGSMIVICSEPLIRRVINSHKPDPATGRPPPEAMVFPVCIAAISMPVGELWFAWTCTPNVHWIWPILAGIPFGAGTSTIFIYATNYLVYSYGIYAASALAGNAVLRSIMGATLPLAGPALYRSLGSHWAGTLLAFLEIMLIPIPFVFYRYGSKIRMKSALIRSMQEDKEKLERKRRRAAEKLEREMEQRAEAEAAIGGVCEPGMAMDEEVEVVHEVVETAGEKC